MNWRAYELKLSAYLLCPSANKVSIVSDDLPEPETPVTTINLFLGISTVTFYRLCIRAPLIRMLLFCSIFLTLEIFACSDFTVLIVECKGTC